MLFTQEISINTSLIQNIQLSLQQTKKQSNNRHYDEKNNSAYIYYCDSNSKHVIQLRRFREGLYDPSYQTANPMGDGFAAPDGFDWNMTTTSILNIEIDDELYNQIEILDANPFSTSDYHILAKGVAKKGQAFSQEINYTEGTNYLYIRKTDSRSRVSISTWDVSKNKEFVGSRTTRVAKATIGSYNIPEKYPKKLMIPQELLNLQVILIGINQIIIWKQAKAIS